MNKSLSFALLFALAQTQAILSVEAEKSTDNSMLLVQDEQGNQTVYTKSDATPEKDVVVQAGQVYKKVDEADAKKYTIIYKNKEFVCGLVGGVTAIAVTYGLSKMFQSMADISASNVQSLLEAGSLNADQIRAYEYFSSHASADVLISRLCKVGTLITTMVLGSHIANGPEAVVVQNDNAAENNEQKA